MKKSIICFMMCLFAGATAFAFDGEPGQATSGYGSSEGYLDGNYGWDWWSLRDRVRYETLEIGSQTGGTHVWAFVPEQLVNGSSAPVYIYLHGYAGINPSMYMAHIEHLVRQGYIVVFPIFQPSHLATLGDSGVFKEAVQQVWLDTAVLESQRMIDTVLGTQADTTRVYLYGHSVGGALATRFIRTMQELGVDDLQIRGIVMAHPQIAPDEGLPSFVKSFVRIRPIDYADGAQYIDVPTIIMSGDRDKLALMSQVSKIYSNIPESTPKAGWMVRSSELSWWHAGCYHDGSLYADHGAPMSSVPFECVTDLFLDIFGVGAVEVDTFDYRIYFAATDAIRDGIVDVPWDMGTWEHRTDAPLAPVRCDGACR